MGKDQISQEKKKADFMVKQQQGYSFKKAYARIRAHEFENECYKRGLNFHVSVGGVGQHYTVSLLEKHRD